LLARRKALVTNDDGIDSPGLVALAAAAVRVNLEVVVAAPVRQSSRASAGIIATTREGQTLIERRQRADLPDVEAYAVDAQPGYIVRAAVRGDPAIVSGVFGELVIIWDRERRWLHSGFNECDAGRPVAVIAVSGCRAR
jgi:5'/3'-nucleotidase SurE